MLKNVFQKYNRNVKKVFHLCKKSNNKIYTNMKDEYLILRISKADKEHLRNKADKKRLSLSSYARMELFKTK